MLKQGLPRLVYLKRKKIPQKIKNQYKLDMCTELKTLEWDILNPDRLINLEIKFI